MKVSGASVAGLVFSSLVLSGCGGGLEQASPELTTQAGSTTVTIPVVSPSDDAEEILGGGMELTGGLLDLRAKNGVLQTVGVRFQNVTIPRGAIVESAYFTVKGGTLDSGSVTLKVQGEAADNALTFSSSKNNISSRSKTGASVTWQPNSWVAGSPYKTGNLATILQEIVNRSGWQSGNALALIIEGVSGTAERSAIAFGGAATNVPSLVVTYSGDVTAPPTPTEPTPTPPTEPAPEPTPEPEPVPGGVSNSDQQVWHARLRSSIDTGRYAQTTSKFELEPLYIASTGDSYNIGRFGNMLETAYVLAYRETGDRKLMDFVNKFMVAAQRGVADHNRDGFRDILYKKPGTGQYYMQDTSPMEEMLAHGTLASLTLALKQAGYSSTAAWWTDYLKNDYAPKRQMRVPTTGVPDHRLTHPRTNYIRYFYAMYKLTGDSSYLNKAKSEAVILKKTIRSDGWSHWFGQTSGCQPMVYVPLTSIALADLATNGSGLIDTATMNRAANVVATRAMKNTSGTSLGGDSCGNGSYGGISAIATFSYTPMAAWDSTGRIVSISERVYNATERYNLGTPLRTPLPAALTFVKGR